MTAEIPLWTKAELCALFDTDQAADITGISIDSRTIMPGELFIALSGDPGPRFGHARPNTLDGHDYVRQAREKGAAAVLVHREVDVDIPQIMTENTLDGLWLLGSAAIIRPVYRSSPLPAAAARRR